jgi:hypothetical protein
MIAQRSPLLALAALVLAGTARAVTPAPIPVTVTNAPVPFGQTSTVTMNVGVRDSFGTFTAPANQRLLVQTLSVTRYGSTPVGSGVHCLIGATVGGNSMTFAVPSAVADGSPFPSSAIALTFEVDANTQISFGCHRTDTSQGDTVTLSVAGQLLPN